MQDMDTARQEVLDLQAKAKIALEVFNKSQKDVLTNETDLQKYRTKAREQTVPPPRALSVHRPMVQQACCHHMPSCLWSPNHTATDGASTPCAVYVHGQDKIQGMDGQFEDLKLQIKQNGKRVVEKVDAICLVRA